MNAEVETAQAGYLTLLPYLAREGFTFEAMIGAVSPWGAPTVTGIQGSDADGVPWLGLINETPLGWLRVTDPIPKYDLELLHLQRFAVDFRCATGRELYAAVSAGSDPPDLLATVDGVQVGWELTAFTIQKRRQAQSLFFEVIGRLALQQRHRMTHLTGYNIFMWFGGADDPAGLPFQKRDQAAYEQLVESVVAHRPNPSQFRIENGEVPQLLTDAGPVRTTNDVSFFAIPLLIGAPASGLFAMTGINAGLAFQSDHTAPDEWVQLQNIVNKKDRIENERLLISVGAPDRMGRCFPTEETLARFMLDNPHDITAQHLPSVILHFWSTGEAFELIGGPIALWPPIYQGFVPPSHPFSVPDVQGSANGEPAR